MQKKLLVNLENKVAKKTIKKSKDKLFHIVYYVENCTPAMRKFTSIKDMETFFKEFEERYPKVPYSDNFLDFYITSISGEVKFL